jgi:lipoprotein-releasing system ATP-binding protein
MIEARGIVKSYGKLRVLHGVDLNIKQGEIVAVIGRSGAGKSTLLHILGTLDRPDEGSLYIDGEDVFKMNDLKICQFRNKNLGFVFQFHHLLPEFTALENVMIPALISGKSSKDAEIRARFLIDKLQLSNRLSHKPSELSGGEQQRVSVARALMNEPAVIFADEPSGNLDSQSAASLHALFLSLRNEFNQTFVMVTHNMELAAMADRTIVMQDGNIMP